MRNRSCIRRVCNCPEGILLLPICGVLKSFNVDRGCTLPCDMRNRLKSDRLNIEIRSHQHGSKRLNSRFCANRSQTNRCLPQVIFVPGRAEDVRKKGLRPNEISFLLEVLLD